MCFLRKRNVRYTTCSPSIPPVTGTHRDPTAAGRIVDSINTKTRCIKSMPAQLCRATYACQTDLCPPHAWTIRSIWFVHAHTSCTDCGTMRDHLSSAAHVNLLYCTYCRYVLLRDGFTYQALATSLRAAAGARARTASHVLNYSTSYTKPSCQGKRSLPMSVSPDH